MNKVLLIAFTLFFGFVVNAQMTTGVQTLKHTGAEFDNAFGAPLQKDLKIKGSKGSAKGWFHHASSVSVLLSKDLNEFSTSSFYLFHDTSINIYYTADDEIEPVWWLAASAVVDPTDPMFDYMNEDPDVDEFAPASVFTMDSLGFNGIYIRNSASTVVDTLVIQIQKNATSFQDINYNGDVIVELPWIYHDLQKWYATLGGSPNANVVKTLVIPLDSTMASRDTLINGETNYYYRFFEFPMDMSSESWTGTELPKISVTYISGSQYTPFVDTLFGAKNPFVNSFRVMAYKATAGDAQSYYSEKSCSYFFSRQFAKSSATSEGYMPFYLYMMGSTSSDFPYEYFDFYIHYTTNNVSISESSNNTISVSQNQPNPFNASTTINYNLVKSANVSLDIYNVAGAKVMTVNQGVETAGSHKLQINAESLNAGIYFYTLTADGYSVTKKMIVY